MKIVSRIILSMTFALMITLSFTSYVQAEPFKSMSFGGATGLISTPTAHTGWEGNKLGLDVGYHYVHADKKDIGAEDGNYHIPKALVHIGIGSTSLELGFAYDIQPDWRNDDKTNDMLFNAKWVFMKGLAIGGNFQRLETNWGHSLRSRSTKKDEKINDKQIYFAATYPGDFFTMPAEVTMVVGHTFYGKKQGNDDNDNIDFSMGFDLDLLPKTFKHYVHWINDFSNYSYSTEAGGADAWYRGCFNTGVRIAFLKDKRLKLNLDIIMTDAFDENRDWAVGLTFGSSL